MQCQRMRALGWARCWPAGFPVATCPHVAARARMMSGGTLPVAAAEPQLDAPCGQRWCMPVTCTCMRPACPQAMQNYYTLTGRRIPFTMVRGMSDFSHQVTFGSQGPGQSHGGNPRPPRAGAGACLLSLQHDAAQAVADCNTHPCAVRPAPTLNIPAHASLLPRLQPVVFDPETKMMVVRQRQCPHGL